MTDEAVRTRRPPPPFRQVSLIQREYLTPHLLRLRLAGDDLAGFDVADPAASVRLLIGDGSNRLTIPTWTGNEFLYDDGSRPIIRTFTPRRWDPELRHLDLDVVIHSEGAVSRWAQGAALGAPAAVSGPGRGYRVDPDATAYLLAGDETAVPAISQLLEVIPPTSEVSVIVEINAADARMRLTDRRDVDETWAVRTDSQRPGDALIDAVRAHAIAEQTKVWAAGEAAAMFQIRKHLFEGLGMPRSDATVRGYWKVR